MTPRRIAPTTRPLEDRLLADAVKLRGVGIERLGYYGGPARTGAIALAHTLDNEELEPFYDTEAERSRAEHQARLLAGCLWSCSSLLIKGLYDDIFELRIIEDRNVFADHARLRLEFINEDSSVLHRLPPAYAANYTAEFAQKFLVVLAGMTTKLAGVWTPPSCLAEELSVHCLADLVEAFAEAEGLDLGNDVEGTLYEALLEDTDHLFMYPVPGFSDELGVDAKDMVALMSSVGFAELDFNIWFEPFNDDSDRAVSPYAHNDGAPVGKRGGDDEEDDEDTAQAVQPDVVEAVLPADRARAIAAGDLIDVTEEAQALGFNCSVAFTREARTAILGPAYATSGLDDESARISDIIFDAVKAASAAPEHRSATFYVPGLKGAPAGRAACQMDVVAGSVGPGSAVVTIQLSQRTATP